MEQKKTFCFDIDGVLTNEAEGFGVEVFDKKTPNKEIIDIINALYKKGHEIILHTSRFWCDREVTIIWLVRHGVKYHELIMRKPLADYYIDDKNLTIEQLKEVAEKCIKNTKTKK